MSKSRKITAWILVGLMSALFIMSALMKLTAGVDSETAKNFAKFGLEGKGSLIGMGELISAILFHRSEQRKQNHIANRRTICKQHHQAINTNTLARCRS